MKFESSYELLITNLLNVKEETRAKQQALRYFLRLIHMDVQDRAILRICEKIFRQFYRLDLL